MMLMLKLPMTSAWTPGVMAMVKKMTILGL
jgi:hypothetical protein